MDRGRQAGLVHAVCHRCWTTHPESNSNSNTAPPPNTDAGPRRSQRPSARASPPIFCAPEEPIPARAVARLTAPRAPRANHRPRVRTLPAVRSSLACCWPTARRGRITRGYAANGARSLRARRREKCPRDGPYLLIDSTSMGLEPRRAAIRIRGSCAKSRVVLGEERGGCG